MDTQTGQIHTLTDEETALFVKDKEAAIAALSERIGVEQDKLVPLDRLPTATCKRCNGSGRIKAGMQSKRFKPCKCTQLPLEQTKTQTPTT